MSTRVTISDLERAINRARTVQPAAGPEATLRLEVSTMAALYGRLIYEHRESVGLTELSAAERVALRLWAPHAVHEGEAG
jgi:hypothetical protein